MHFLTFLSKGSFFCVPWALGRWPSQDKDEVPDCGLFLCRFTGDQDEGIWTADQQQIVTIYEASPRRQQLHFPALNVSSLGWVLVMCVERIVTLTFVSLMNHSATDVLFSFLFVKCGTFVDRQSFRHRTPSDPCLKNSISIGHQEVANAEQGLLLSATSNQMSPRAYLPLSQLDAMHHRIHGGIPPRVTRSGARLSDIIPPKSVWLVRAVGLLLLIVPVTAEPAG